MDLATVPCPTCGATGMSLRWRIDINRGSIPSAVACGACKTEHPINT